MMKPAPRIPQSLSYIASSPVFQLTSKAIPRLQRGQMTKVYRALAPHPGISSLDEIAEQCSGMDYKFKTQLSPAEVPLFLRKSILYHLDRMNEINHREVVREVSRAVPA